MKAIIVESKGAVLTGTVTDTENVVLATQETLEDNVALGALNLIEMLAGEAPDLTKKKCTRCIKMGRVPFHPLEDFSLLKTGKRHSQCRICRTEQSNAWCAKRAEHRKAYHKDYHQNRPKRVTLRKGILALIQSYGAENEPPTIAPPTEALFVGFSDNLEETK